MSAADETSTLPPAKPAQTPREPRLFPPLRNFLIALGLIATGVAVWWFSLVGDHAIENIVLLILCFFGMMWPIFWFAFFSGQRGLVRFLPMLGMAAVMASPFLFLKLTGVNGELRPSFAWRWSSAPDELLETLANGSVTVNSELGPRFEVQSPNGKHLQAPDNASADPNALPVADLSTTTPEDYPQFLGPKRNLVLPNVKLAKDWQANPPKKLWSQPIGAGWSAFAVVNGYAVTMEQRGSTELVTCYDVKTGELKWSHGIQTRYATLIAGVGPRSTPTIHEGRVYALGGTGVLRCIEGDTGKLLWQRDLLKDFNIDPSFEANAILYGRANSPLIVDGLVIVPAGGPSKEKSVALVAYDKLTGEERWRGGQAQVAYASPALAEFAGQQQVVIVNEASVTGHDPKTGEQLWSYPWPGNSNGDANCSQAVPLADDLLFLSKAYGVGSMLLKLKLDAAADGAERVWQAIPQWHGSGVMKTKFTNVAIVDGYVYGLSDGILECIELATGERKWKKGRYHHGQVLAIGDVLLVMAEQTGDVVMVALTPDRHQELGKFNALESEKVWNNLALYGPYLLVRDAENAACYELNLQE